MRPLRALVAILFLLIGVALGALNSAPAMVDLGLLQVRAGLGVILLCTLLAGVLSGGLVMAVSVVLPLRRELRRARKTHTDSPAPQTSVLIPTSPSLEPCLRLRVVLVFPAHPAGRGHRMGDWSPRWRAPQRPSGQPAVDHVFPRLELLAQRTARQSDRVVPARRGVG